mmetsp:Transcript_44354/g.106856  ORF Transcript_44354/g.106856 Transcript_44354/m.106856 type:complete len:104 (+) Transcript_44354:210-521(+)
MIPTSSLVEKALKASSTCCTLVSFLTTKKLQPSAVLCPTPANKNPVTVSSSPITATSFPTSIFVYIIVYMVFKKSIYCINPTKETNTQQHAASLPEFHRQRAK